jgi:hypothetical protein
MNEQKLTPWFPADVKPVHVGVYQTTPIDSTKYQKWNGEYWCAYTSDAKDAARLENSNKSKYQKVKWRGLAEQPK